MARYPIRVGLGDTDAAGVLFFPNLQRMAQTVCEAWLESVGVPIGPMLEAGAWLCPVVHAESDFVLPLRAGDRVDVRFSVEQVGRSSFSTLYLFERDGATAATVRMVHVVIDRATRKSVPIPEAFRKALESA